MLKIDLTNKIKWLQANDRLAKHIALNAIAFGRSYLRLEDHLCYAAAQLEFVASLERQTNATISFSPVRIDPPKL